jgi:predicted transcriptional regulator
MSTLTLRVPDDLDRALERQSAALGISKSDLAREALKHYLRVAEFRTKLVARAQASGLTQGSFRRDQGAQIEFAVNIAQESNTLAQHLLLVADIGRFLGRQRAMANDDQGERFIKAP